MEWGAISGVTSSVHMGVFEAGHLLTFMVFRDIFYAPEVLIVIFPYVSKRADKGGRGGAVISSTKSTLMHLSM